VPAATDEVAPDIPVPVSTVRTHRYLPQGEEGERLHGKPGTSTGMIVGGAVGVAGAAAVGAALATGGHAPGAGEAPSDGAGTHCQAQPPGTPSDQAGGAEIEAPTVPGARVGVAAEAAEEGEVEPAAAEAEEGGEAAEGGSPTLPATWPAASHRSEGCWCRASRSTGGSSRGGCGTVQRGHRGRRNGASRRDRRRKPSCGARRYRGWGHRGSGTRGCGAVRSGGGDTSAGGAGGHCGDSRDSGDSGDSGDSADGATEETADAAETAVATAQTGEAVETVEAGGAVEIEEEVPVEAAEVEEQNAAGTLRGE